MPAAKLLNLIAVTRDFSVDAIFLARGLSSKPFVFIGLPVPKSCAHGTQPLGDWKTDGDKISSIAAPIRVPGLVLVGMLSPQRDGLRHHDLSMRARAEIIGKNRREEEAS